MAQQLTLNMHQPLHHSFASFMAGRNQQLINRLKSLAGLVDNGNIYLWGQPGSGKSHLLQALCLQLQTVRVGLQGIYLNCYQLLELPAEAIADLEHMDVVVFDDIDQLVGHGEWEEAIFHFYNKALQEKTNLVFSAQASPHTIGIQLPDLKSRLCASETYHLEPLSDQEKSHLLIQTAKQRGFLLQDNVADFILQRTARDIASLQRVINCLDESSLVEQRKITIPFVKQVLAL